MPSPTLNLGARRSLDGKRYLGTFDMPTHHLLTHGVILGMTGSGKTGLLTVLVEEALNAEVPVLMIDVKGDLPNLALAFPSFDPALMAPWVEAAPNDEDGIADAPLVAEAVEARRAGLAEWSIGEAELARHAAGRFVRVVTPGSEAGEPLHLLSALERRSPRWDDDLAAATGAFMERRHPLPGLPVGPVAEGTGLGFVFEVDGAFRFYPLTDLAEN